MRRPRAGKARLRGHLQVPDPRGVRVVPQHRDRPRQRQDREGRQPGRVDQGRQAGAEPAGHGQVRHDRQGDQHQGDRPLGQDSQAERRIHQGRPAATAERVRRGLSVILGVESSPRGVNRQCHEEGERPVVAGLAQLDDEENCRRQDQSRRQPDRPAADPPAQSHDQADRADRRQRRGEPGDEFVATTGHAHQRRDRPARQRRLFEPGAPLDVGHEPVAAVDRVDRLGDGALLPLPPQLQVAEEPEEHRARQGGHDDLRGPASGLLQTRPCHSNAPPWAPAPPLHPSGRLPDRPAHRLTTRPATPRGPRGGGRIPHSAPAGNPGVARIRRGFVLAADR